MSEIQKYSGMWKFFEDETPYQGELHINTDDNVIVFVNSQLICLLTYHILVQIGFDPTEIRKKVVERMHGIEVSYEIQSDTHRIEP